MIEPAPEAPLQPLCAATGDELVVLLPGNQAPNKGYATFRQLLEQVDLLDLPIRFRVLGRVDAWIRRQLAGHPRVELLGRYDSGAFAVSAVGCDLALFLSPWPETYCITFDEWTRAGRAAFFLAMGALAEAHRQRGLHPASRRFEPHDVEALQVALIEAASPHGLEALRRPWPLHQQPDGSSPAFAGRHWDLFNAVLARPQPQRPLPWRCRPHQRWGEVGAGPGALQPLRGRALWRARLRRAVYRLPAGHRAARLWRRLRGG